ncbi:hypothetical protein SEA_TELAVIV_72 [Mycobacterium phage TelAviv]|uniref:CDGP domain-containing protein n=1 Tax=Mycobacterium phage Catdawg TaxID=1340819 RepID=S5Z3T8_9CAUD|nr:hypothetical protein PBI_CATDAWG_75 [Mycobacterium phage Catdawg]ATW60558.1 hypothetical protein SEA_FAMILTON_76 [Mycobacterium phage Familton]AVI04106.1 hypothetical protein SEA_JANGDYNASTY_75 [Mycobacterium phage JangDynasty]AVP42730.1 hypothetical protein SEA_SCHOOLBUS_75 [Mycobacterium phage SchoolBus]QFP97121.1 hypothetical protein SEA_KRILI_75 [Mycobacterium phage Krili]QGJ87397.1 hypothetical protein SEA_BLESSICA_76 [Mycobacterium phage Blessica]QOC58507.1 membrane protein [Mycobact
MTIKQKLAFVVVGALIGAAIVLAGVPKANATPPNCQQQLWWRGEAMRFVTRTLCDGPIQADGSWNRARNFYGDAFYVPVSCYRWSCTGGYWRPVFDTGIETYRVTPETVLPDEPGHIGPAGVVPA